MIKNGNSIQLDKTFSTLPDVSIAMQNWFQPMKFIRVVKSVVDFQNYETRTDVLFKGVWQSLNPNQLQLKPEGQRTWNWYQVHTDISLVLDNDEVIEYRGVKYRVMSNIDQTSYGYMEYHIVDDFTGVAV